MRVRNLQALRRAFETGGVRFVDEGEYASGVVPPLTE